ncbi:MAG: bifunctional nuclease domain-containing protein [Ignavibacteria bacterium]
MDKVRVEIAGLHQTPTGSGAYALILREVNGNRNLPIIIGAFEAQAIAMELEGIKPPRPLTHDLTKNLIESLGATLVEVIIDELRDNTFYAKLILDISSMTQEVDARPSDAIALSVRFRCPIFASETVMREAAFEVEPEEERNYRLRNEIDDEEDKDDEDDFSERQRSRSQESSSFSRSKENRIAQLKAQLKEAIEKEEYEKAAKIRDELKKLTGEGN